MKSILVLLAICSFAVFGQYQSPTQDTVATYQVDEIAGLETLKIPVNFNQSNPLKSIPDSINDLTIQRIDLVYSINKANPDFDQKSLNKRRINAFTRKFPASKNDLVAWREIGQSSANSPEEAKDLFHGFVIYYRPTPTEASMEKELAYLDELLGFDESEEKVEGGSSSTSDNVESTSSETTNKVESIEPVFGDESFVPATTVDKKCYVKIGMDRHCTPKEMTAFNDSIAKLPEYLGSSFTYTSFGEVDENTAVDYKYYWLKKLPGAGCEFTLTDVSIPMLVNLNFNPDYNVVEEVFNRNPTWRQALVVMDVTGSMSPYIGKTMTWVKERAKQNQINAFVFFNDGNRTPDNAKKMGQVGGVYGVKNSSFDDVYGTMRNTMSKGFGGDCPENNVEATLKGIKDYPNSNEIVMVADNWATPRDMSLVKDIGKPVHVILCGAYSGINPEYVQLAYDTGGSVHTIEEDLDMLGVKPGETFMIGGSYFTIVNGKIVKASNG